ncbi:UDP-glucose dehydrogenase family protein [Paenibacillus provencensis]|uniref:UDP-glucose 6-dehydrogenase n=1 Tax=Paenibacillus provencensis TaxID=441151 RepID=A0ABW3PZN0_9BACL|nr:UDP-glucose/GDP-mannose dehydrogenase family protein [Paenibacillus sp. MER 78]MCM3128231.1 UDP-glucose/GDP-mannose dehydrogenase family protein [Paenibacillus sp. MER 78]
MKIAMIGTGYVGLTSGACYAEMGHQVICVDNNQQKIQELNNGICPIFEPGLKELMVKNISSGNLSFTSNIEEAVKESLIIMIAVGTPSLPNGGVDMSYVDEVARQVGNAINDYKVIVNKSTVPVGSADRVGKVIQRISDISIDMASVPEFLREGSAVQDILNGERIVIGVESERAKDILVKLHQNFNIPIQVTDIRSAELIKYAANSFLALKISFINEIANLAEKIGADVVEVAKGIGSDSRIGNKFLNAGIGFGGACFPKDTLGLISIAEEVEHDLSLMKEVVKINKEQYKTVISKLLSVYSDLRGKTVSVLGLSFKPNTNDLREAPSLRIITDLIEITKGNISIRAYDPIAMEEAATLLPSSVEFCSSIEDAVRGSDAAIIVTEWKEIIEKDWNELIKWMNSSVIIDGRNSLNISNNSGVTYLGIGRKKSVDSITENVYL